MEKLESLIKTYYDFPKKGIAFKDILGIIQDPEVFRELIFLQACKPMIVARKPGKLPGDLIQENYNLEYGKSSLSIQKGALEKFNSFAIVDDLLATGGTIKCVDNLIKKSGKEVSGCITVIELLDLKGRKELDFNVESIIKI